MAVRPIDSNIAKKRLQAWIDESEIQGFKDTARNLRSCMSLLDAVPTLTPPNEWVSVKERLPEHLKDVITLYGNGKIDIDWVDSSGDFKFGSLFDGVTHWMPLPAPPDKDNNVLAKTPNEPLTLEMVAEILAEQFGDECACNVNGNDEWLPMMCHYADVCPDPPEHLGCWMELLRNKYRRPPEGDADA